MPPSVALADRLVDTGEHLVAQVLGNRIGAARLVHELLDRLFEAVLAQTRSALVEVLSDLETAALVELPVEVAINPGEHLVAWRRVRVTAAHGSPAPFALRGSPVLGPVLRPVFGPAFRLGVRSWLAAHAESSLVRLRP